MADDQPAGDRQQPAPCQACRGTGKVISNLGGSHSEITCPWCEGSGRFIADHDAQARWSSEQAGAGEQSSDQGA